MPTGYVGNLGSSVISRDLFWSILSRAGGALGTLADQ